MEKGYWITKDGIQIRITDMADDHLINAIRLLKRVVRKMRLAHSFEGFSMLNFISGEMAEIAVETALEQEERMDDEEWLAHHTPYDELIEEAKRRDILMFIGAEFFKRMNI